MDVIQCPACELRFTRQTELRQHVALDHPELDAELKTFDGTTEEALARARNNRADGADRP